MAIRRSISEIVNHVSTIKSKEDKIAWLRENDSVPLQVKRIRVMAKTFKKFREDYDEWDEVGDDEVSLKEQRLKNRRDRKRSKREENYKTLDEKVETKRN